LNNKKLVETQTNVLKGCTFVFKFGKKKYLSSLVTNEFFKTSKKRLGFVLVFE